MAQHTRTPTQYLGSVSVLLRATTLTISHVVPSCTVALVQPVVHEQRFLGKRGQVEAEMHAAHTLRGCLCLKEKGGLCLIFPSHEPGLLPHIECQQSIPGGVPRHITEVHNTGPLCVWSCWQGSSPVITRGL